MCKEGRKKLVRRGTVTVLFLQCCMLCSQPCTQVLQQAQSIYENGEIASIPEQLSPCLEKNGFTKEEEIRAKKLNTLVHIFMDSVSASEEAMVVFLRTDPEHQLDPSSDPKELFYLYNKFRTKPIFRLRISIGANYTLVKTNTFYGVENLLSNLESTENGFHFIFKGEIEKELFEYFEMSVGTQFSWRNFRLNNTVLPLGDYAKYTLSETQFSVDIPLVLRFLFFTRNRFQPYLSVGWAPSLLLTSTLSGDREAGQTINLTGENLLSNGLRRFINYSALASVGFRLRLPGRKTFFFTEISYQQILNNMSNPNNRYSDEIHDLPFRFAYVDNDFSLRVIHLNLGMIFSVYNPKKLKKYIHESW